ncbi:Pga2p [Kluyveromyces lactis]|uniref:KLLA0A11506p n=1 Tax=Kluyveromyces lactis (strain ATCC 8585 / CBS 2359 / DSM 70799 / NBRC 1267 / NRRL Y-1140 / WM37) TaxID=284590 RepID=Q6CX39_KLULA|nr:uncharacterized protein KLLA0_A11506g [Kluyveromyces lactis]CAH03088.1 KLLA0A11506p [Kluyveromyces lactis]|eukprot:XP_451500.1 uncharacterized protein KLLA0_A11506g [Kluyveromyces lactis]
MEVLQNLKTNLYQTFDIDLQHAIRLIVIVGGYFFLRQIAQRELAKRQLKNQLAEKDDEAIRSVAAGTSDGSTADQGESSANGSSFGWGNRTRQRVKKQEELLESEIQRLQENGAVLDPEDDKDIEDLLID